MRYFCYVQHANMEKTEKCEKEFSRKIFFIFSAAKLKCYFKRIRVNDDEKLFDNYEINFFVMSEFFQ